MKSKILIPMMAFVFAIGMSFATERSTTDQASDYVLINGFWLEIPEQPCVGEGNFCRIQFEDDPAETPHDVYDEMDTGTIKYSSSTEPVIIERPLGK